MKERPIIFSTPMVQAVLAGRKTQTRRFIKWPVYSESNAGTRKVFLGRHVERINELLASPERHHPHDIVKCPYGQPGYLIWVRESFWLCDSPLSMDWPVVIYEDEIDAYGSEFNDWYSLKTDEFWLGRWYQGNHPSFGHKPSIHMPRWASRISLRIVSVRAERLQDISEEDARAEGAMKEFEVDITDFESISTHRLGFKHLWKSINGHGSWDANPWVWRIEFEKVTP